MGCTGTRTPTTPRVGGHHADGTTTTGGTTPSDYNDTPDQRQAITDDPTTVTPHVIRGDPTNPANIEGALHPDSVPAEQGVDPKGPQATVPDSKE